MSTVDTHDFTVSNYMYIKVERESKWNYAASFKLRLELEKQSCYHKR